MMKTLLTESPEAAAQFIRAGEVVAFPTETVYGLGANVFDESAIQKIFQAKGRPIDNPLIVHIAELSQLDEVVGNVGAVARRLIAKFFPGPLTVILPRHSNISQLVTAGLDTVGVRMPGHSLAREFLACCKTPVAAPSANLSGKPSPTTWEAVAADLEGRISCILKGNPTEVGLESTVVDCTHDAPVVLRAGAVTLEQLQELIPATRLADKNEVAVPRSPGMKYRHYAPQAKVSLVARPAEASPAMDAAFIGCEIHPQASMFGLHEVCSDVEDYARVLFHFFRQCDAVGIRRIYCQAVSDTGLGLALMDRIRRATEQES